MSRYVVDASVAAKWFLTAPDEGLVAEAVGLSLFQRAVVLGDAQVLGGVLGSRLDHLHRG